MNSSFARERLRGVVAAVLTPITPNLTPDLDRLANHCRWLLENGCDGLTLLGTTGEAPSLSTSQRIAIMRGLRERGLPLDAMLAGTGAAALEDAVAITRAAVELGFAGALVAPPFYFKDVPEDGVFGFFKALLARVGEVPVYLYHVPQFSYVPYTVSLIGRLLEAFPKHIVGFKNSSSDAGFADAIHAAYPTLEIFPNSEGTLLAGREAGYAGCISASLNVSAPYAGAVWRGPSDAATQQRQLELGAIRAAISKDAIIPALRYLVAELHDDPTWRQSMPPVPAITPEAIAALEERLAATTYRSGALMR